MRYKSGHASLMATVVMFVNALGMFAGRRVAFFLFAGWFGFKSAAVSCDMSMTDTEVPSALKLVKLV